METATDQFPEVNLPWTPGVIARQPSHVILCSVNLLEQKPTMKEHMPRLI